MSIQSYYNIILFFGCPAGSTVQARSTIAVDFFEEMKNNANPSDGKVVLPDNMATSEVG